MPVTSEYNARFDGEKAESGNWWGQENRGASLSWRKSSRSQFYKDEHENQIKEIPNSDVRR